MEHTFYDESTAQNYDEGYRKGYDHLYPNENILRLERWYFKTGKGRLLDHGYGFGANLIYLAERGYFVEGIDVAESAKDLVLRKLKDKKALLDRISLKTLTAEAGDKLLYADNYFDYILSNQTVYHLGDKILIDLLLAEFLRILKPGGKMIVTLMGPTNILCQAGKKVDEHVYEYLDVTGSLGRKPMRVYVFENEEHVREAFNKFQIDEIGWFDNNYCGINGYHFVVLCSKPAKS